MPQNQMLVAHQVEVAQAIELVVIGDTGRAIAEADLGPNIKVDLGTAVAVVHWNALPLPHSSMAKGHGASAQTGWLGGATAPLRFGSADTKNANAATSPPSPKATTAA